MNKFLDKVGVKISVLSAIIGVISDIASDFALDSKSGEFFQFIKDISIGIFFMMLAVYAIKWLETGIKAGEMNEEIKSLKREIARFNELFPIVEQMKQDIEEVKTSNIQLEASIQNLKNDPQKNLCPIKNSSYVETSEDVNNELYELLKVKKKEIKELHIICFGRNGFGGAVKYIIERKIDIKVRIIVFNPESHPDICQKDDNIIINKNIENWLKGAKKIEVIVSEIPPMIRAAVAYTKDKNGILKPMWGSIQSYRFAHNPDTKAISLEKPANSLISVCEENKTVIGDLYALVNSFEEEFKRLEENSKIARCIRNRGKSEIIYEERNNE